MENFDEHNRFKLMSTKTSLSEKLQKLETLDEQILSTLEEEDEITCEIDEASDIKFSINECIFAIDSVLNRKDTTKISTKPNLDPSTSNVNLSSNRKLPSLSIKTFYGNPLEYSSFRDSFRAAIHENDSLKNITKFNYLISYLKRPAKAAISGILITESNYLEAVELLQKRFGNKQILITSNIDQLVSISLVNNINEIKKSRQLLDIVESTVRNLKSLDIDTKQYGPVLISVVMNKLPETIRLDTTRSMSESQEWDVDALLEVLRKEINSRELCSYMSNLKSGDNEIEQARMILQQHAAALFSGNSGGAKSNPHNITSTFCKQNYTSSKCNMITYVNSRKAILKSKGKCFASECKSTNKRYKCGSRHHLSICDFHFIREKKTDEDKQDPNHITMLALNKEDGVLLQTVIAVVFNRENSNCHLFMYSLQM